MDQVITYAGLALTFLTAIATLLTVLEMKRQRRHLYRPDLHLESGWHDVYGYDQTEEFKFFKYISEKRNEVTPLENNLWLDVKIWNLGFGAAKFINVKFEFDFKMIFEQLQSVAAGYRVTYEKQAFRENPNYEISICKDEKYIATESYNREERTTDIDFIRPDKDHAVKISIPDAYMRLLSYYVTFKHELDNPGSAKLVYVDDLREFPPLFIRLQYLDMANKRYNKKIEARFSIMGNHLVKPRPVFGKDKLGQYRIRCREID